MQKKLLSSMMQFLHLTKPRMWIAIAITIIPGFFCGNDLPSATLIVATIIGTCMIAISSFIFNQIWEIEKDQIMHRTKNRPLPSRKIQVRHATFIGFVLFILACFILYTFSGTLATILAILSFSIYIFLYTILLKPRTAWNTLIGGFSGAVGPLIGEAAVSQEITITGWAMFGLLFIWQPPHFWVLAIKYKEDYQRAKIKMLPVIRSLKRVYFNILIYQVILIVYIALISFVFKIFSIEFFAIPNIIAATFVWILMFRLFYKKENDKTMLVFYATIFQMILWHILISIDLVYNLPN